MTVTLQESVVAARAALPRGALRVGADWLTEASGGTLVVIDPSTSAQIGTVPLAGPQEIEDAVAAARKAFPAWRAMPPNERRDLLLRLSDLLLGDERRLRLIGAQECGRPVRNSAAGMGAEHFRYYAGWADKIEGSVVASYPGASFDYVLEEPYGVVAAVSSWNGPISNISFKLAPALTAGNCVVLKVPEAAPFSGIRFAELCEQAGFPAGVVNVLVARGEVSEHLIAHPGVDKISFTGGPEVAKEISRTAAARLAPTVMELGGKSANLIFADADIPRAAAFAAQTGVVINAGQGCLLPTRLLVQESVRDEVLTTLYATLDAVVVGLPLDPMTHMGPVISEVAADRILGVIRSASAEGHGQLSYGGERLGGDLAAGNFIRPAVFTDVDPDSPLAQREVFGPVLAVQTFRDEEEGLALANSTAYGLAGFAWTSDVTRAHRVAAGLHAGSVSINGMSPMAPTTPFGGNGWSGHGREGGRWGLHEFLRPKNVWIAQ